MNTIQRRAGRPRSEITAALAACRPAEPATWLDMARRLSADHLINLAAPAELQLVRWGVNDLARRGELARVGKRRVPGAARPMTTFLDPALVPTAPVMGQDIEQALRSMCRRG